MSPKAPREISEALNDRWAHLSLIWPKISEDAKNPKLAQGPNTHRMSIALKPQSMEFGNHQRTPATFNFPLKIRETSGSTQSLKSVGTRSGAYMVLNTIMHYFSSENQW
ncbi:hypothetical protein O181_111037 [Austropuccinia psidii MF-1]|uniref:Uncharacterized protein n=1 Tax=Austropuccinia psidii MF-1 TaxID=1389203 RepID=A0A9Q3K107_9BASI|nr:hypothetical protein [Austropuccinia psidii MF-1]